MSRDKWFDMVCDPKQQVPDYQNPALVVQSIHTGVLVQAATGKINLNALAIKELKNRGLDRYGRSFPRRNT
jgi:hypothetical protein